MVEPVTYFCADSAVTSVCFIHTSEDLGSKNFLIAGTASGSILIWNLRTSSLVQSIACYQSPILWLESICNDFFIVQARFETELIVFAFKENLFSREADATLENSHPGFCHGDVQDTNILVVASDTQSLLLQWKIKELRRRTNIKQSQDYGIVTALKIGNTNGESTIFSCYECGKLVMNSSKDGAVIAEFAFDGFVPLALDIDTQEATMLCVVAGSKSDIISLQFDAFEKKFYQLTTQKIPTEGISSLKIRKPDRKILLGGCWDSTVRLFSWLKPHKLKPLGALKFHTESVECVAFTRTPIAGLKLQGHLIAAGSKENRISLWKVFNE